MTSFFLSDLLGIRPATPPVTVSEPDGNPSDGGARFVAAIAGLSRPPPAPDPKAATTGAARSPDVTVGRAASPATLPDAAAPTAPKEPRDGSDVNAPGESASALAPTMLPCQVNAAPCAPDQSSQSDETDAAQESIALFRGGGYPTCSDSPVGGDAPKLPFPGGWRTTVLPAQPAMTAFPSAAPDGAPALPPGALAAPPQAGEPATIACTEPVDLTSLGPTASAASSQPPDRPIATNGVVIPEASPRGPVAPTGPATGSAAADPGTLRWADELAGHMSRASGPARDKAACAGLGGGSSGGVTASAAATPGVEPDPPQPSTAPQIEGRLPGSRAEAMQTQRPDPDAARDGGAASSRTDVSANPPPGRPVAAPAGSAPPPSPRVCDTATGPETDATLEGANDRTDFLSVGDASPGRAPERGQPPGAIHPMPAGLSRHLAETVTRFPNQSVELTLSPEELGRVRMTLSTQDGALSLNIQADRPETMDLLRRNIDQLARDFRDLGFTDMSFSFSQGNATPGRRQPGGEPGLPAIEADAAAPPPAPAIPARTIPVSAEAALDLRL
ncbi:MAG: flagellar hook-length control protein FliK [Albidovulum sp.]